MDAVGLGRRIHDERERAGLSQGQVASAIGLDRTAVNKIEAGIRKVTALELAAVADVLGMRMARLLEEPLPAIVSHRSHQGLEVVDSRIDRALADIADEVDFIRTLGPSDSTERDPRERVWPLPQSDHEAEALAGKARELIGYAPDDPATRLVERVSGIGLWAFSRELGVDTADAGMIRLSSGGVCLVNSSNKVGRRRLALAHELGHYLVQDDYTVDWRVSDGGGTEARLDRFARAMLLPNSTFPEFWRGQLELRSLREASVITASTFYVDMATLARRVSELSLPGEVDEIRRVRTTKSDIVEWGLNDTSEMEGTSFPTAYEKGVLRLYRDEQISLDRALELLQGTYVESDLPERRIRSEGELWKFVS
ncbi:helix-turn-helix domain-containing protein [Clavibacter tessellarius]|uniref:Cro/Cl family transcriptional regulator n=1 Tax=Clavibacter tessellarius TaxID=31965 RepID=A0A154V346_9MICO|nr:XRE family transcriptional regulator [Clavibacter michiganensis]KZC95796.1 Cro/Cl family transcriptional regulator [Clavibacter michiganensis subsp. tessellarius]